MSSEIELISAACKIEFVPLVGAAITLVDEGGWMRALPRFTARQPLFEPDGIGRADGYIAPLGGVEVAITFTVAEEPGTAAEMFAAFLATLPSTITGALVMTGGDEVTTFEPATLDTTTPALPGPDMMLLRTWQVSAALPTTEEE